MIAIPIHYCLSNAIHGTLVFVSPSEVPIALDIDRSLSDLPQIWNVGHTPDKKSICSMANNNWSIKRACASIYFRLSSLLGFLGLHHIEK